METREIRAKAQAYGSVCSYFNMHLPYRSKCKRDFHNPQLIAHTYKVLSSEPRSRIEA